MITFETKGFSEFEKALSRLPQNVENRVLQNATMGAMRSVRKVIVAAAPRSEKQSPASREYGRLKQNIKVSRKRNKRKGSRGAVITTGKAFWGFFLERGTRYIPAKPWFAPAFRDVVPKVLSELGTRLGTGIEREFKKLL